MNLACTFHVNEPYTVCTVQPLLTSEDRRFLQAVSALAYANPFLPERADFERAALADEFEEGEPVWCLPVEAPEVPRANAWRVVAKCEHLAGIIRNRLAAGAEASDGDLTLYEDAVLHVLYQRCYPKFLEASFGADAARPDGNRWRFYQDFASGWKYFFELDRIRLPYHFEPAHVFACFRQIQVAFEQIFRDIIGGSMPAARLRAAVWQSIFTHDFRRYRRTLYNRMAEFATLITGPSGTGKELAARAIAQSAYVPFNQRTLSFEDQTEGLFYPMNVSALSPALVESELFGHRRGAFTGAIGDRKGWLETCPSRGAVFLDELGDLDPAIQVKLLRVIETRTFHPVGGTVSREFRGKLIAATNRDLSADIRGGRFREDLYYRLCSDLITTPALAEQLEDSPRVLRELVVFMARKVAGAEAEELVPEVLGWIETKLGATYSWPGNYRELEQCVKNVLIRRNYQPSRSLPRSPADEFLDQVRAGVLTADEVLQGYCTIAYARLGSYEETARTLGLDRRTVKSKIDQALLVKITK